MPTLGDVATLKTMLNEPATQAVQAALPHVERAVKDGKSVLIANALAGNIDGDGSFHDNRQLIVWKSDGKSSPHKDLPANVGAVLTLRWISHGEHNHLWHQAKGRGVFMTPKHLNTGELRQILRYVFPEEYSDHPKVKTVQVETNGSLAAMLPTLQPDVPVVTTPAPYKNLTMLILAEGDFTIEERAQRARESERLFARATQLGLVRPETNPRSIGVRMRELEREGRVSRLVTALEQQGLVPSKVKSAPAIKEKPSHTEQAATEDGQRAPEATGLAKTPEPVQPPAAPPAPSVAVGTVSALDAALAALKTAEQAIAQAQAAVANAQREAEVTMIHEVENRVLDGMAEYFQQLRANR